MGVGPLVHYSLSALGPLVVADLDLSATAFGVLWFVIFGVASLLSVTGGTLTDRFGPRYLVAGAFLTALVAIVVGSGAPSYAWLLVAAGLSGIGQALTNPATNALISTDVAPDRQGLVLGIKQSGVQAGQFVAGLALPSVALLFGWRWALLTGGALALAGLALTLRVVPGSAARSGRRRGAAQGPLPVAVRWMTAYSFLMALVTQATNVYLPLYVHDELGAPVGRAGLVVAALGGVGIVARLAWGALARESEAEHAFFAGLAAAAAVAMVAFHLAAYAGEWLVWAGAALFSFSALAANVVVMLAVVRTVGSGAVGRASGWTSRGLYLGYMAGPPLFGAVVDAASYAVAWLACAGVGVALLALSGAWWRQDPRAGGPR